MANKIWSICPFMRSIFCWLDELETKEKEVLTVRTQDSRGFRLEHLGLILPSNSVKKAA
jgi:hypothetical protein